MDYIRLIFNSNLCISPITQIKLSLICNREKYIKEFKVNKIFYKIPNNYVYLYPFYPYKEIKMSIYGRYTKFKGDIRIDKKHHIIFYLKKNKLYRYGNPAIVEYNHKNSIKYMVFIEDQIKIADKLGNIYIPNDSFYDFISSFEKYNNPYIFFSYLEYKISKLF